MAEMNLADLGLDENQRKIVSYLFQNPGSLAQLGMLYRPTERQALRDSANNVDFGGITAIRRALGLDISPNTRVSEDFGALQAANRPR